MITDLRTPPDRFPQAGTARNECDPADAPERAFTGLGPVLRLCTLRSDPPAILVGSSPSEPGQRRPADDSPAVTTRWARACAGRDVRCPGSQVRRSAALFALSTGPGPSAPVRTLEGPHGCRRRE